MRCPKCKQNGSAPIEWHQDSYTTISVVCRSCKIVVDIYSDKPCITLGKWREIFKSKCVVCGRGMHNEKYFSDNHQCPEAVERGRKAVDNTEYVERRHLSDYERLKEGFAMMFGEED